MITVWELSYIRHASIAIQQCGNSRLTSDLLVHCISWRKHDLKFANSVTSLSCDRPYTAVVSDCCTDACDVTCRYHRVQRTQWKSLVRAFNLVFSSQQRHITLEFVSLWDQTCRHSQWSWSSPTLTSKTSGEYHLHDRLLTDLCPIAYTVVELTVPCRHVYIVHICYYLSSHVGKYTACVAYLIILELSAVMSLSSCAMFRYIQNTSRSFEVTWLLINKQVQISQKWCDIMPKCLLNVNRNLYDLCRSTWFLMTLSVEYLAMSAVTWWSMSHVCICVIVDSVKSVTQLCVCVCSIECLYKPSLWLDHNFEACILAPQQSVDVKFSFFPRQPISYRDTVTFEINGISRQSVEFTGQGTELQVSTSRDVKSLRPTWPNVASRPKFSASASVSVS